MKVAVTNKTATTTACGTNASTAASMPTVLDESGELHLPEPPADTEIEAEGDAGAEAAEEAEHAEEVAEADAAPDDEEEEGPVTVPADVCCLVPGCGRKHGRMCTFPAEGEMRTAWTSVLEAVFPGIHIDAPEPKLKLLCEEHFDPSDFDEKGLIHPEAVPTLFPGGVKVIYNRDGTDKDSTDADAVPVTCCVPGCLTCGPPDTMYPFPETRHRAWSSIITAATGNINWKTGELDPTTKRPLELHVCQEHFAPECFTRGTKKKLKPDSNPSLFDGGKKKVVLRPAKQTQKQAEEAAKQKPKPTFTPKKSKARETKKQGPVFVNVTDEGLQLLFKNGTHLSLNDLTLSELRRIRDCLKDKLRTDVPKDEKVNLELCLTQVGPVLEEMELQEIRNPEQSPVMLDVMALDPDMTDPDVRRLVDNIKQVDSVRRDYERSLTHFFEDADGHARDIDAEQAKVAQLKKKIANLEANFLRHFKYNDQRQALMGSNNIRWGIPTLMLARNVIQKIGKTAYFRVLKMGLPLPPADIVSLSMERGHAQNAVTGLVEVLEQRQKAQEVEAEQHHEQTEAEEDRPPAKRAKPDDAEISTEASAAAAAAAAEEGDGEPAAAGPLQSVTAEQLQHVLAGRGTLQDSHGRTIKVSLAEVPGAPPGAKTVVMETPDDAGHVSYVPNTAAAAAE